MTPHIRPATERDLTEILRIHNAAIRDTTATWDEEPWTMEQRRNWWLHEHAEDPWSPVLVAEADGAFAGFTYLSKMSEKSGWRFSREDTIYVDPPFHGRGLGRLMLTALLDLAKERGPRLIVASITSDNIASIALHQHLGFELMGTMKNAGYKFGRWLDTTYWQIDLHDSWPPRA